MQKLQCEICGGNLVMTEDGESAICESCGMRFKKETIKKMVMELSGPVQVEGIQNSNSLTDRAEIFLRLGETAKAKAAFQQLTDEYPADYRGWWGLTRLMDWEHHFYAQGVGEAQPPLFCRRALEFSDGAAKAEIQSFYDDKVQSVKPLTDAKLRNEQTVRNAEQAAQDRANQEYQQKLDVYNKVYSEANAEYEDANKALFDARMHYSNLYENPPKPYKLTFMGSLIGLAVLFIFLSIGMSVSLNDGDPVVYNLIFVIPIVALVISLFIRFSHAAASSAAVRQHAQDFEIAKKDLAAADKVKVAAESKMNAIQQERPQK